MTRRAAAALAVALAALSVAGPACSAGDEFGHAVVLVYHHVADDTPASTSVGVARFREQLDHLARAGFDVVSLERIARSVRTGEPLPARAVALTFDDAYESVYTTAWPLLAERGWPFAVFVASDAIDRGYAPYMTWAQLAEMAGRGVTLGSHTASHAHPFDGDDATAVARFVADAERGAARIAAATGVETDLFAYPYGEYDARLEAAVARLDWIGFGQQSGVIGPHAAATSLPRFPIAASWAKPDAFALRVNARPLPVRPRAPESRLIDAGQPFPALELTLLGDVRPGCFDQGGRALDVRVHERTLIVSSAAPAPPGRSKFTCTAQVPGAAGAWAWYSHLWIAR